MTNLDDRVLKSIHPTPAQISAIPLFAKLDEVDLVQISKGLICKHIARNEYLFRQGKPADGAFFVQSGVLNVVSSLPGGGEVHLARRGPGSVLGETSLVSTGVRTASVRAETEVVGFTMERRFFHCCLGQASPAAARILSQLIQMVGNRLNSLYTKIAATDLGYRVGYSCQNISSFRLKSKPINKTCAFSYQPYLQRLQFFSNFQTDEIRMFESQVGYLELPSSTMLFPKDDAPISCFFVIRGALELCILRHEDYLPIAILGPGTFLGATEIVSERVRIACGRVRENAALFEITATKLRELLSSHSWFALKFQIAFCESLVIDLGTISKRVAQVTSQVSLKTDQQLPMRKQS